MKGRLLLALFALPFAAVGAWMAWSLGQMALDVRAMRGWDAVPATVIAGGYHSHADDDGTTYEAWATYQYAVGGRNYTGERVQLAGGADNIGDYQQALGRRLQRAAVDGSPITVYVDPADPARAIVDRQLRWGLAGFELLFLLLFGGVGFGLLVHTVRAPAAADASRPEFLAAPWLANPAWQSAEVRSASKATAWGAWLFAAFWNLVSAPLPFLVYEEVADKENYLALLGIVFPVVGIGLLVRALRHTLEWRRFGATPVHLDPFPGSIGGHVGGTIETRIPYAATQRFRVTLSNIHSRETGSGDDRRRTERAVWQDEMLARAEPSAQGTRLTFRFDVPEGLAASHSQPAGSEHYLWRLQLRASLPGADLDRSFDLPVYPTARPSRHLTEQSAGAPAAVQSHHYEEAARARLRIRQDALGKSLYFPMGQQALGNAIGILVGGSFAAAGWLLAMHEGRPLFGGIFGSMGGLVFLLAAGMLGKSLEVRLTGDLITSVRRYFGIVVGRRRLRRSDFLRFEQRSNLQTKSGSDTTNYYRICGIDRAGHMIVLGENFAGEAQARAAIAVLAKELGLRENPAPDRQSLDPSMFDRRSTA